ncbi:MAG TPA: hypothetical protein DIS94_09270, partial [Bacteroidetes bacterium]|nr:hypothetical protein [Bacteroidota bacterium]
PRNSIGEIPLSGNNLQIITLSKPLGQGIYRKLLFPFWFLFNLPKILKYTLKADVIHSPVPGDVGTMGIFLAVIFRKNLFIRYCGNWFKIKTSAEKFWKYCMENLKGKKYLMLATGGDSKPPSLKNPEIKWIFSTSISANEINQDFKPKTLNSENINLIIVSRQELEKGTGIVLEAVKILIDEGFKINLKVVGDGAYLNNFKKQSDSLFLNNYVQFLGKLSNVEVKNQLKSSDIFCFPTWSSEGFPKVVGEALAYGLPVVATPVSVIPELLSKGGGLLIEKPDPIL